MAEAVGLASGVLALAGFAFQTSVSLYQTIQSFQSHPKRVADLNEELQALTQVLNSLNETIQTSKDIDLSLLRLPLLRCGNACQDFERILLKCSSRAGGNRTSFRDWAKLKYMGDDVEGFKKVLEGYRLTVLVALAHTNLRNSILTAEEVKSYQSLLKTTTDGLQIHLERIDGKLEDILERTTAETDSGATELRVMEQERLSTQKCLQLCAQLSNYINQMQLQSQEDHISSKTPEWETVPNRIVNEGLQECKNTLNLTITKLEDHMKDLTDRFIQKSKVSRNTEDEINSLSRLQDTWEAARKCRDFCSKAGDDLKENISVIDNCATGNAMQIMVSTSGKILHGKNQGDGAWIRQVGGYISDTALIRISQDMSRIARDGESMNSPAKDSSLSSPNNERHDQDVLDTKEQRNRGAQSTSQLIPNTSVPLVRRGMSTTNQSRHSERDSPET